MSAEVWFRNPKLYIRECVEVGADLIAWDRGFLAKHRIDPTRFIELYLPASVNYRMLAIGDQGTAELRRGNGINSPAAVYPTWVYGEGLQTLETWLANPVGEDEQACGDMSLEPDVRPVLGQEHRVVVTDVPPATAPAIKTFYKTLAEMQADYPEAIVHVHGLYSFNIAFGNSYGAVDIDPRPLAKIGKVNLPNGREVRFEDAAKTPQWVEVVGFNIADLSVPRNRCMFNMKAAQWAAVHYQENIRFRVRGGTNSPVDSTSPTATAVVPVTLSVKSQALKATVGDKFLCETCSLANTCKYFRDGSVCSLPDTEAAALSRHFNTRNSDSIIDGLGVLMETQAERLAMGRRIENEDGELNPEVSKIIDGMFNKGIAMAKLIDPSLRPGPLVTVPINLPGQVAAGGTAQELAATAVGELEKRGYRRDQITAPLIEAVLAGKPVPPPPLEIEAEPDE